MGAGTRNDEGTVHARHELLGGKFQGFCVPPGYIPVVLGLPEEVPDTAGTQTGVENAAVNAYKAVEALVGDLPKNDKKLIAKLSFTGIDPYHDVGSQTRVLAIDQGYDDRGSRPVANSPDPMWEVVEGGWYGWPDFVAGEPITSPRFRPLGKPQPEFVLATHPPLAGRPIVEFPPHWATMKFGSSTNPRFGFVGEAFVAQLSSGAPVTGRPRGLPGFKVVRVNLETREINDFLVVNHPGPDGTGPARPVDAKLDPFGDNLHIVDFGVLEANLSGIVPWARSGALWRISRG